MNIKCLTFQAILQFIPLIALEVLVALHRLQHQTVDRSAPVEQVSRMVRSMEVETVLRKALVLPEHDVVRIQPIAVESPVDLRIQALQFESYQHDVGLVLVFSAHLRLLNRQKYDRQHYLYEIAKELAR